MLNPITLKALRQTLKACSDDTRLRILNVLQDAAVTVNDLCRVLHISQSTISKHLSKLRLLRMVGDKRVGNRVYYSLNSARDTLQGKVTSFITFQFSDVSVFRKDREAMQKLIGK